MFKKFLKYYLPVIIWAGIIFYFSSRPGLRYFSENIKEIILRKGAHFVEFSILAILLWRIFYFAHNVKIKKAYFFSLILAIIFGFSDEWHQTFVFSRKGKIIDTAFDAVSIFLMLELVLVYTRKKITSKNILVLVFSVLILISNPIKIKTEKTKTKIFLDVIFFLV